MYLIVGKSVNHVVLMAQLIVSGKNNGIQAFIVPVRDMETHLPLPGKIYKLKNMSSCFLKYSVAISKYYLLCFLNVLIYNYGLLKCDL